MAPAGAGRLQVTIAAGTSDLLPVNTLEVVRFGAAANALIDAGGQTGRTGGFDIALPAGTRTTTFVVRRATPGAATTVPLVVVDRCDEWPTIVGGGPSAF